MDATYWTAIGTLFSGIGNLIIAIGIISGVLWGIYTYKRNCRAESARWLYDSYKDFFFQRRFSKICDLIEYHYKEKVEGVLRKRVEGTGDINNEDIKLLRDLDCFLNYFDFIIYLENEGHFNKEELRTLFNYWLELMKKSDYEILQNYIKKFGFKRIQSVI